MMDCLLANTSARNPEIGAKTPLSRALCHAQGDLIHATQSQRPQNGKDAAGGVTEAAAYSGYQSLRCSWGCWAYASQAPCEFWLGLPAKALIRTLKGSLAS